MMIVTGHPSVYKNHAEPMLSAPLPLAAASTTPSDTPNPPHLAPIDGAPATSAPLRASPMGDAAPCVVLDTNVWIDILVFDDPITRPIRDALIARRLDAVIDAACLYELNRVLDYSQFARFAVDKAAALERTLQLARLLTPRDNVEAASDSDVSTQAVLAVAIPRCSDRDDQKFLELAAAGQARWLVTKDKALLKLTKRFTRDFSCRIDKPATFVSAVLSEGPA